MEKVVCEAWMGVDPVSYLYLQLGSPVFISHLTRIFRLLQKRQCLVDEIKICCKEIFGGDVHKVVQIKQILRSAFLGLWTVNHNAPIRCQARLKNQCNFRHNTVDEYFD